jgi:hypothetical protein
LIFVLLAAVACARKSEEQKLVRSMSSVSSWAAALPFIAEQWLGNRVPTHFFEKSLTAARKQIETAQKAIEKSNAPETLRARFRSDLNGLTTTIASFERAARDLDPKTVRREIPRCLEIHDDLDSAKKEYGPS